MQTGLETAKWIFVLNWYHGLLKDWRLSLGRLQFEVRYQGVKTRAIGNVIKLRISSR